MPVGTVHVPLEVNTVMLLKPVEIAELIHVVPFDVNTLPDVPADVSPVPP
jgi:hypothetical protein